MADKKLISHEKVFELLRDRFFETINDLSDNGEISMPIDKFNANTIFREQSDYDGTLKVYTYAGEDQNDEYNYGIFKFMGGAVLSNVLMNAYTYTYVFETLTFEKYRDDLIKILTSYAINLNNQPVQIQDDNGALLTLFATVQDFPTTSNKMDINSAEKFFSFVSIRMMFYEGLVHSTNTDFRINGVRIPYGEITFERQTTEPIADMKKAFEHKFVNSRSVFAITVNGNYQLNDATTKIMDWLFDASKLNEQVRVYYNDGSRLEYGQYLLGEVKLTNTYGNLLNFAMALMPARDPITTHYPVWIKGGLDFNSTSIGNKEYMPGTTVFFKPEIPEGKVISGIVPTGLAPSDIIQLPQTDPVYSFVMPSNKVIIEILYT
jgi:hypothetical protein